MARLKPVLGTNLYVTFVIDSYLASGTVVLSWRIINKLTVSFIFRIAVISNASEQVKTQMITIVASAIIARF